MIKVNKSIVRTVTWEQNPKTFDDRLCALGPIGESFYLVNPEYDPWILNYIDVESIDSDKLVVWGVNDVWMVKRFPPNWTERIGWKVIQLSIDVILPDILDIIFISYDEINAEENWNKLITKAPYAKRIHGIKGIFEAHKAAAELATTELFYVVDADMEILPD